MTVLHRARRLLAALALFVCALTAGATWTRSRDASARPAPPPLVARAPPAGDAGVVWPKKPAPAEKKTDQERRRFPCPDRASRSKTPSGLLNLNTATAEQLQHLPGIGPAKAARITAWRKRRGRFPRIRDLRRVRGIGRKTLRKLAPHLTVKKPTTLRLK